MKKEKRNRFILLGLFILVWATIFYQILNWNSEVPALTETPKKNILTPRPALLDSTEYKLNLNYSDPFMTSKGARSRLNVSSSISVNGSTVEREIAKVDPSSVNELVVLPINWPKLEYNGLVKSSNNKQVGLLSINNKEFLVNVNETYKKIKINSITRDSIVVELQNEIKILKK